MWCRAKKGQGGEIFRRKCPLNYELLSRSPREEEVFGRFPINGEFCLDPFEFETAPPRDAESRPQTDRGNSCREVR